MVRLSQFFPAFGLSSASSFCLKLETYLRIADIPYEVVVVNDPRKSPVGKLPYITDGATTLTDSSAIIAYLEEKKGNPVDGWLDEGQKAKGLAIQRLVEESLYWSAMYSRWVDDAGWATLKPAFFGALPWPMETIVSYMIRKKIIRDLKGHGRGLMDAQEVYKLGKQDIKALAQILGDGPYFLGEKISSLDATVYGLLSHMLYIPVASPLKEELRARENLVNHIQNMRETYFKEELETA